MSIKSLTHAFVWFGLAVVCLVAPRPSNEPLVETEIELDAEFDEPVDEELIPVSTTWHEEFPKVDLARRPVASLDLAEAVRSDCNVISLPYDVEADTVTNHWSFQPIDGALPAEHAEIAAARIDTLMVGDPSTGKLSTGELATAADPRTLTRRLWFDGHGLPPDHEIVDEFERDTYEWSALVEFVLEQPQFGERWARHWLDVARYADSNGYEYDEVRWNAYPYRDWVIRAINDDLPFDKFVRWQIAGDELYEGDYSQEAIDAATATGFLVAGPHNTFFPQEIERYDELDDMVHTIGQAFLGLSIGCARCHDHKTEPISQEEYYRLVAIFQSTERTDRYLVPDGGAAYKEATAEERQLRLDAYELVQKAARDIKIDDLSSDQFSEADKTLLKADVDPENQRQADLIRDAGTRLRVYPRDIEGIDPRPDDLATYESLIAQADKLTLAAPDEPDTTLAISGSGVAPCWLLEGGDVEYKGDEVTPGFLQCVGHAKNTAEAWRHWDRRAIQIDQANPRSAFAYWLTDVEHGAGALLARVAVNRIWQHYFDDALVTTPNNFGLTGDAPVNAEVIDTLAAELIRSGWSTKHVHEIILLSETYRQRVVPEFSTSPDIFANIKSTSLAYPRSIRRLDAEQIRDAVYAVSGHLNTEMFGPAVRPPIPAAAIYDAGEEETDTWPVDAVDDSENWRRSIYVQHRRSNPFPFLALFGVPEAGASCDRRSTAVVPTQTLALWNEPWLRRQAEELAYQLSEDSKDVVTDAYRRVLQRDPTDAERAASQSLIDDVDLDTFVHALIVSNEFIFLD